MVRFVKRATPKIGTLNFLPDATAARYCLHRCYFNKVITQGRYQYVRRKEGLVEPEIRQRKERKGQVDEVQVDMGKGRR